MSSSDGAESARELLKAMPPDVVGHRLRLARVKQGLSIRDLANRAEVSKTSIVRIEQGHPAFASTVVRICAALGLHLAGLANPTAESAAAIHRKEDDEWFDMTDFGSGPIGKRNGGATPAERKRSAKDGMAVALLYLKNRLHGGMMLPALLEVYSESDPRRHTGEELVYVIDGRLLVKVGTEEFELEAGECVTFWSAEEHSYTPAPGSKIPATALSVRIDYVRSN
ncbi:MAG TPA: XRE family transcriptional regulator [Fimbriimonadaceae bacterium]|nr:XRE family transcriptional regulator [Fimbriimonadaceae bacterium]